MSATGNVLGILGNATTVALGVAGILGGIFLSVPFQIALVTVLMMAAVLGFSLLSFHIDGFDLGSVPQDRRADAEYQHKVLRTSRRVVRIVCPAVFTVIFLCSVLWTQAPSLISREARGIIQDELIRPSANEAVRYIAGPAVAVVRPPRQVGAPVVAPEPSVDALKSRRMIAALPLSFVLSRAFGDADDIFGDPAWGIFFISLLIGFVIWFSDRLNFKRYVGTPKTPTGGP